MQALVGARARDGSGKGCRSEITATDRGRRHVERVQTSAPELLIETKRHHNRRHTAAYGGARGAGTTVMHDRAAARIEPRVRHFTFGVRPCWKGRRAERAPALQQNHATLCAFAGVEHDAGEPLAILRRHAAEADRHRRVATGEE